jgi:hypothetical protein
MVEFDSVVSEALLVIGASGDEARLFAQQMVWRAVTDFPVSEDNIKVCRIYQKNLILKKPQDMQQYIEMALYDANGCYIPHVFHAGKKRIYPDTRLYVLDPACIPVDISEDTSSFYLGTNGTDVEYAEVRYFSYPLDSKGMPMIREEDVLTCMYFVRFMWSLRKSDNRSEIQQNELLYKQEADRARARRKMADISNDKAKTIAKVLNRMIPNFNRSRF